MMLNYYSIEKSMEIAKEKGETFKDFDKSDYANGTYFEKYETTDYSPVTEKFNNYLKEFIFQQKKIGQV